MQSKPWYESITIWGDIVKLFALAAGVLGYALSDAQQATIAAAGAALGVAIGTVISIVGRKQADQPVHFVTPFTTPPSPAAIVAVSKMLISSRELTPQTETPQQLQH